jgi:hypothetical protein
MAKRKQNEEPFDPGPERVETDDVQPDTYVGEFGQGYRFQCPHCLDSMLVWDGYSPPGNTCRCGRSWSVSVVAVGVRH